MIEIIKEGKKKEEKKEKKSALDLTVLSQVRFYVLFGEETGIPIFFLSHRNPTHDMKTTLFLLLNIYASKKLTQDKTV